MLIRRLESFFHRLVSLAVVLSGPKQKTTEHVGHRFATLRQSLVSLQEQLRAGLDRAWVDGILGPVFFGSPHGYGFSPRVVGRSACGCAGKQWEAVGGKPAQPCACLRIGLVPDGSAERSSPWKQALASVPTYFFRSRTRSYFWGRTVGVDVLQVTQQLHRCGRGRCKGKTILNETA